MITWRKSSRSGGGGAGSQDCVEVADLSGLIAVRDSKRPDNGHLALSPETFTDLITRVKNNDLSV